MTISPGELLGRLCATGASLDVVAPFTGEVLYALPVSTESDVAAAFDRARVAQHRWAEIPLSDRTAIVLRFHDLLLANRNQGLDLVQMETGKARRDANEEVLDVCITARHYARDARRLLRTRRRLGAPMRNGRRHGAMKRRAGFSAACAAWATVASGRACANAHRLQPCPFPCRRVSPP